MNTKLLLLLLLWFASGRQVAFVDLSSHPRTDNNVRSATVRGGGILYHGNRPHPLPETPPVSLKLTRIITSKDGEYVKDAVEVVLTNTSKTPVSVPIGDDPVPLLAPTEKDRRAFVFDVRLHQGKSSRTIGSARAACNSAHKECSAVLQPDDTILFWLPAGTWQKVTQPLSEGGPDQQVSVSVSSTRMVIENGKDNTDYLGEPVNSENELPMPHLAKVQMIDR